MTTYMPGWLKPQTAAAIRSAAGCGTLWRLLLPTRRNPESRRAEERIAATLERFARDIRRLHTADQALYAAFDTFVRLFLTCIPDPPPETLTAAKVQGQRRYQNYQQNVARNMKGDARAALGELTERA